MAILDTLITGRIQGDVERAIALCGKGWDDMAQDERDAFLDGLKGAYGPTDMNRVRGAIEYIDARMRDAKRGSVVQAVPIAHATYDGTRWRRWTDVVCSASDYVGPDIYLPDIDRLWAAARRFTAIVPPRYDPDGNGYIRPGTALDAGKLFTVMDSVGLQELRVAAQCPPCVMAGGTAWVVSESDTGWTAALDYTNCPYPDLDGALAALSISCGADAIVDGAFTLSATLRYGCDVDAGTCRARWSPFIIWDEAEEQFGVWDGAKPRTWGQAARGGTA